MGSLSLSCSVPTLSLRTTNNHQLKQKRLHFLSVQPPFHQTGFSKLALSSASVTFNPLRFSVSDNGEMTIIKKKKRRMGTVCYAAPLTARNLQWISAISSAVLMLARGTAIQKSFLVPLFALQAPSNIISWIKGEYGTWAAFLALLVRLFFFIPGELELPLGALLLAIVAPHQVMKLRGTQEGAIISLVIAGYMAFQHFSRMGRLQDAFDGGSIVATASVICICTASSLLLI